MINSVSSVNFKGNPGMVSQDPISRPGSYTRPDAAVLSDPKPKKKGSFGKALAKLVVAALVVGAGALVGFKKNAFKVLDEAGLKDAKFMQKVGHKLGQLGKWIDDKAWSKLTNLFKKSKAAEEVAENAAEAVAKPAAEAVS